MMDVAEIRNELASLEETLDIDSEIIEYIVRDLAFAERIFIYETNNHPTKHLVDILKKLDDDETLRNVVMISDRDPIPSDCSEYDCFLAISEIGEDNSLIRMVETAKNNHTYVYAFCSNINSPLAFISDSFVYIPNTPDFNQNTQLFFKATANRLYYFVDLAEYEMDGPPKLNILDPLFQPEKVRPGKYSRHIDKRITPKEKKEFVKDMIIMIIFMLILLAIFYGIIFLIQYVFGIPVWDNLICNGTLI